MDLRKLKTLIDLVSESNISELEIAEADGKVRIVKAAGMGLDENVLRVLPLWRFEPGRQNDRPVAAESTVENTFNLY